MINSSSLQISDEWTAAAILTVVIGYILFESVREIIFYKPDKSFSEEEDGE